MVSPLFFRLSVADNEHEAVLHAWDIALLFTQRVERIELRQAAFYCEIAELPRQNLSVPHECADIQIVVGYIGLVAEIHRKAGVFEAQQLVFRG